LLLASSQSFSVNVLAVIKDCVPLVNLIGIIFQIRNDYLSLCYTTNKGHYEDLREGKFSFPTIHVIRSDPANHQLSNILKQKTTDEEVKWYAVKYIKSKGSFEYCKKVLKTLGERARKLVAEVEVKGEGNGAEGGGKRRSVVKILETMVV
jgi:geranylgeranyl diphosphate synthase, type III